MDQFSRTRMLFGSTAPDILQGKHVAVFGIGGVGGAVAESLVRTGVGAIDLIDHDTVDITNLNRQIIATYSTIGQLKVDAMEQRLLAINPSCHITTHARFYLPETASEFDFETYDYIIDAVDTVTAKINLIMQAQSVHTPLVSAMGAGNKTDPTAIRIADIYDTSVCPLARIMRKELRKRGVKALKVAFSIEAPLVPQASEELLAPQEPHEPSAGTMAPAKDSAQSSKGCPHGILPEAAAQNATCPQTTSTPPNPAFQRRTTPGSNAFVPAAMGLALAAEVTKDLLGW